MKWNSSTSPPRTIPLEEEEEEEKERDGNSSDKKNKNGTSILLYFIESTRVDLLISWVFWVSRKNLKQGEDGGEGVGIKRTRDFMAWKGWSGWGLEIGEEEPIGEPIDVSGLASSSSSSSPDALPGPRLVSVIVNSTRGFIEIFPERVDS